jgi:hypothetical protein
MSGFGGAGSDSAGGGSDGGNGGPSGGESANGRPRTVETVLSDLRGLCLSNEEYKKFVLKLLRVGSAQNAPLELKQEIAAVRLLQFGLTAAHLRQAVARAADVAENSALRVVKDGEADEEGGDSESSGADLGGTTADRESHALVIMRIPKEARCKAKITDEDGVKGVSWAADGGMLSGAPVISGARGRRIVARWSAAAAGRSTSGTGSVAGSARRPTFGVSELGRLLHTMADARMGVARRLLCEPRDREDLDGPPVCPWDDHISQLFNDTKFTPAPTINTCNGITASAISAVETRHRPHYRDGSELSKKYGEFRSAYTIKLSNFQKSGQSDELDFPSFADGNVGIMYGHCFFSSDEGSILADMSVRLMPEAAQREEGLHNSGSRGSDATSRRKKRARDTSHHTEILVRGMESLKALDEELARECEKVTAVKVRHEADAAGFHAATAKSAALESVLSVIASLEGKIKEEESKETGSEDRVLIYKTLLDRQYENLKIHM